jgi:hypothetical protein
VQIKETEIAGDHAPASEVDPNAPIDDSDSEQEATNANKKTKGIFREAPSIEQVEGALIDLEDILRPPRQDKSQSYQDPGLNKKSGARLLEMQVFGRALKKIRLPIPGRLKMLGPWLQLILLNYLGMV